MQVCSFPCLALISSRPLDRFKQREVVHQRLTNGHVRTPPLGLTREQHVMQGSEVWFVLFRQGGLNADTWTLRLCENVDRKTAFDALSPATMQHGGFMTKFCCLPTPPSAHGRGERWNGTIGQCEKGIDHIVLRNPPTVPSLFTQLHLRPHVEAHGRQHVAWNQREDFVASFKHKPMMLAWPREMDGSFT